MSGPAGPARRKSAGAGPTIAPAPGGAGLPAGDGEDRVLPGPADLPAQSRAEPQHSPPPTGGDRQDTMRPQPEVRITRQRAAAGRHVGDPDPGPRVGVDDARVADDTL